ncbi:alpha-glucosidase [Aureobasidium subglaciale]|nr:alpha-glucosidase [Aureobasidium subglaciale]
MRPRTDSNSSSFSSVGTSLTSVDSHDASKMRVFLVQTARGLFSSSGGYKANICLLRHLASRGHVVRQICYFLSSEVEEYIQRMAESGGHDFQLRRRTLHLRANDGSPGTDIEVREMIMDDGVEVLALSKEAFEVAFGGKEEIYNAMSKETKVFIETGNLSPRMFDVVSFFQEEIRSFCPTHVVSNDGLTMQATSCQQLPDLDIRRVVVVHTAEQLPFGPFTSGVPGHTSSPQEYELLKEVDGIWSVSNAIKKYAAEYGQLHTDFFVHHPWTYLEEKTHRVPLQLYNCDKRFVGMINPCAVKGTSILLDLAKACPHLDFLVYKSWGFDEEIGKQIATLKNMTTRPACTNMDEAWSVIKVLLVPSVWYEAWGIVVIEAHLRGIPVISSDAGALPEAMRGLDHIIPVNAITGNERDEQGVYKVPEQNVAPWVVVLNKLMSDKIEYERLAQHVRDETVQWLEDVDETALEKYLAGLSKKPSKCASFQDTNGDGYGDVKGITSRLDYLKDLGIYKSPQVDMGYDISDYNDIDPMYGTLTDVDELIAQLGKRGMKLMMDLVVNHTSNEASTSISIFGGHLLILFKHSWFRESASSTKGPKRDWYFWKKGKVDANGKRSPPNNWCRTLDTTESAWEYDEKTQEYYLSLFSAEQPDLNWDNPDVRTAVHDILRFWLDRGTAGFRMDVIDHISKVQDFPDAEKTIPGQYYQPGNKFFGNGPRLQEFLQEMRKVLDEYDTITVGEMPFINDEDEIIETVGMQGSLNMVFLFKLLNMDNEPGQSKWSYHEWDATDMKRIHERTQRLMIDRDGWNAIFVENHDGPRSISRFADDSDEWRDYAAKMLCTKGISLGGTEYIYQGQELGMRNIPPDWALEEYKDIETQKYWEASAQKQYANNYRKLDYARGLMQLKARDHTRTPMQWDSTKNAGFCKPDAKPWMRVNDDYPQINVAKQLKDPGSVFAYWRDCLKFRKEHKDVFIYGGFEIVDPEDRDVVSFRRFSETESYVTVTNFSGKHLEWTGLGDIRVKEWIIGNYPLDVHNKESSNVVKLRPWEGVIGRC